VVLKDIIGQQRALDILRGCIARNRVPHALCFAGDEGIGKRLTAVNFAKALNCRKEESDDLFAINEEPSASLELNEIDNCGVCASCRKIDKGNHPDVIMIAPEGDGGQITVSVIRELQSSLSYKPFEGKWKIAIIDNADRLNQSAANAFLQTLEEPSPESILILISSRPDMLIPTIRSRCQRINFSPLPMDTMSALIEEKAGEFDKEQSLLLSRLSGGRLGYALNGDLIAQRDRSFDVLIKLLQTQDEDLWDSRDEMEAWFDWCQMWLRDLAVFKATGRTDFLINSDKENEIKSIISGTALKDILKLAREIYNIRGKLNFNLNKQLTLNYTSLLLKKSLRKSRAYN
jgi:DNA polymerase-3 subunit delta'